MIDSIEFLIFNEAVSLLNFSIFGEMRIRIDHIMTDATGNIIYPCVFF